MKRLLFFLCVLVCCLSAAQAQTPELDKLSSSINDELMSLKEETASLKTALLNMSKSLDNQSKILQLSETERKEWETKSTALSTSLQSINEQLNKSYEALTVYKHRLRQHQKALAIVAIILIVLLIGKGVGYYLYAKGIKLPRWLDILL